MMKILNFLNLFSLALFCFLKNIQIINCHHLNVDTHYAHAVSRLLNIKTVITLRGGETEEWIQNRPDRKHFFAKGLKQADYITAVSQSLLNQAIALVPTIKTKSRVIPNGIDMREIQLKANVEKGMKTPSKAYYLFAGRLEEMKNVECLIDAYLLAQNDMGADSPALILVGEGSQSAFLKLKAASNHQSRRIRFMNDVPHENILHMMNNAKAIILPSKCSEGCPNVILEAMALGTPVIVSDLSSLKELVTHQDNGFVFPVGDANALKGCLIEIAKNNDLARRISHNAKKTVQRYTLERTAKRYLELYTAIAGSF